MDNNGLPIPGYPGRVFTPATRPAVELAKVTLPTFSPAEQKANRASISGYFAARYHEQFDVPAGLWGLTDSALATEPLSREAGVFRNMLLALTDRPDNPVDIGPGTPSITFAHLGNATGASPAQLRGVIPTHSRATVVTGQTAWRGVLTLAEAIDRQA